MAIYYTDAKIADIVERDIENFARAITDSYCQTHEDVKTMDPTTYANVYFKVFKESLQTIEKEIEAIREKEIKEFFEKDDIDLSKTLW